MPAFDPFEQVSVLTSAMVVLATIVALVSLYQVQQRRFILKIHIWMAAFVLAGLAELNNGIYLLEPDGPAGIVLGNLVDLFRVLAAAMFLCGAIFDLLGQSAVRRLLFTSLAFAIGCWLVDTLIPLISVLAVLFQVVILLSSFVIYTWLATRFQFHGAGWIALGMACFFVAILMVAHRRDRIEWVTVFDGSAIANLLQVTGLIAMLVGQRLSMAPSFLPASVRSSLYIRDNQPKIK